MAGSITPFLMFEGRAEEAVSLYVSLFDDGEVVKLETRADGKVQALVFRLKGRDFRAFDSPAPTPSASRRPSRCSWTARTRPSWNGSGRP